MSQTKANDEQYFVLRCKQHPRYTASRPPRAACRACHMLFNMAETLQRRGALKVVYIDEYKRRSLMDVETGEAA